MLTEALKISDDRITSILSLILKTPGLVMLEYWCQNIGLENSIPTSLKFPNILHAGLNLSLPFEGILLMLLPLDLLVAVYMHIISAVLLFGANVLSQSCVEEEMELFHNSGMGKGSLYDSHIDFMKTHLYDNKEVENKIYEERDTYLEIYSLPAFITSILQPSPLIKRQIVQCMCYISLSMLISWCLSLEEDKDQNKQYKGMNIISSINRFLFRWLPMAYIFPLCARIVHSYFHEHLITMYLEHKQESTTKEFLGNKESIQLSAIVLEESLYLSHRVSQITVIFGYTIYVIQLFPKILQFFTTIFSVGRLFVSLYGYLHAGIVLMKHLIDPGQFVLFWIALLMNQFWIEYFSLTSRNFVMSDGREWYIFVLLVMSEICRSPLTLIASCLAVMTLTNCIIKLVIAYLNSCKSHAPPSITVQSGLTEGMVMFLLSLQTGLIDLEMPHRLGAMSVILFIVAASLFQTVLEVTHPVLLALSASSRHWFNHLKVLVLCGLIFFVPAYMSHLLVDTVELDLWTMVVISSSLLTSIQVLGHVIHYVLYLYDSKRKEPLESMDDVVYYLKSAIHVLELVSALFVVGAGFKEAWTGHWSVLNSVVLAVHCYFNVWIRIRNGWRSFLLRKAAVTRIQTLEDASEEQLQAHADVCAICYSEMVTSAKITPCRHIFHGGCLKKWLFVQDHCPMCASKISETVPKDENSMQPENEIVEEENNAANENHLNIINAPEPPDELIGNIFNNATTVLEGDEAVAARLQN